MYYIDCMVVSIPSDALSDMFASHCHMLKIWCVQKRMRTVVNRELFELFRSCAGSDFHIGRQFSPAHARNCRPSRSSQMDFHMFDCGSYKSDFFQTFDAVMSMLSRVRSGPVPGMFRAMCNHPHAVHEYLYRNKRMVFNLVSFDYFLFFC